MRATLLSDGDPRQAWMKRMKSFLITNIMGALKMTDAPVQVVYSRPKSLTDTPMHYCQAAPAWIHRLIAEVLG